MSEYSQSRVSKTVKLDLRNVPDDRINAVKQEVGDFIIEQILREVSEGKSPVKGQKDFKSLNSDYADSEKGGDRTPNLELDGDMLDALTFRPVPGGIEVGIFDDAQAPKALGHNTGFKGHPTLQSTKLIRRFIPRESQTFDTGIMKEVRQIVKENKVTSQPVDRLASEAGIPGVGQVTDGSIAISLENVLTDDFLSGFLDDGSI